MEAVDASELVKQYNTKINDMAANAKDLVFVNNADDVLNKNLTLFELGLLGLIDMYEEGKMPNFTKAVVIGNMETPINENLSNILKDVGNDIDADTIYIIPEKIKDIKNVEYNNPVYEVFSADDVVSTSINDIMAADKDKSDDDKFKTKLKNKVNNDVKETLLPKISDSYDKTDIKDLDDLLRSDEIFDNYVFTLSSGSYMPIYNNNVNELTDAVTTTILETILNVSSSNLVGISYNSALVGPQIVFEHVIDYFKTHQYYDYRPLTVEMLNTVLNKSSKIFYYNTNSESILGKSFENILDIGKFGTVNTTMSEFELDKKIYEISQGTWTYDLKMTIQEEPDVDTLTVGTLIKRNSTAEIDELITRLLANGNDLHEELANIHYIGIYGGSLENQYLNTLQLLNPKFTYDELYQSIYYGDSPNSYKYVGLSLYNNIFGNYRNAKPIDIIAAIFSLYDVNSISISSIFTHSLMPGTIYSAAKFRTIYSAIVNNLKTIIEKLNNSNYKTIRNLESKTKLFKILNEIANFDKRELTKDSTTIITVTGENVPVEYYKILRKDLLEALNDSDRNYQNIRNSRFILGSIYNMSMLEFVIKYCEFCRNLSFFSIDLNKNVPYDSTLLSQGIN